MFRNMSQQLNFAATVSVLTLALFAVTASIGERASGGVAAQDAMVTLTAPIQR